MVCTDCAMPSPCAQYKLTDVILHCWQGAGLLEGNPADPAWELGATSPLHKAGLTTGSPCHVSKALQQNTRWRFPADLGHVRGNNLLPSPGAAPAKESGTSPIAQHPPGTAQLPARKRAVSPGAQPVPNSWMSRSGVTKRDQHAWPDADQRCTPSSDARSAGTPRVHSHSTC